MVSIYLNWTSVLGAILSQNYWGVEVSGISAHLLHPVSQSRLPTAPAHRALNVTDNGDSAVLCQCPMPMTVEQELSLCLNGVFCSSVSVSWLLSCHRASLWRTWLHTLPSPSRYWIDKIPLSFFFSRLINLSSQHPSVCPVPDSLSNPSRLAGPVQHISSKVGSPHWTQCPSRNLTSIFT